MASTSAAGILAATAILQILVLAMVTIRLLSRRKTAKKLLLTDWLIIVGMIAGIVLTIINILFIATQTSNLHDLPDTGFASDYGLTILSVSLFVSILASGFIKVSASLFYLSVFGTPTFRRITFVWIAILAVWTIAFFIAFLIEQGLVVDIVNTSALLSEPQWCGKTLCVGLAMVVSDVITDFMTLMLPVPMILKSTMPTSRKLAILGVFMTGALSVGASIGKAVTYTSIGSSGPYTSVPASVVWNLVEVQIGIVAASLPASMPILNPLFARPFRRISEYVLQSLSPRGSRGSRNEATESATEPGSADQGNETVPDNSIVSQDQNIRGAESPSRPESVHRPPQNPKSWV